jgi:hypothetical protein
LIQLLSISFLIPFLCQQQSTVNRLNSLDIPTIRALSNVQIYELLHNELDLLIGPVTSTTRRLYEKILEECADRVDELHLIQAKYRRNQSTLNRPQHDDSIHNKENELDVADGSAVLNQSARPLLPNYSFTEDEANAEIGRQIRFGMSSTPITEPKHTRFPEPKTVSFNYLVEEEPDQSIDRSYQEQIPDSNALDYRPLATGKMHTVRATLGPRPQTSRPVVRNFVIEHSKSARNAHRPGQSHFFRNVCISAILIAVFALFVAYKIQNL